MVVSYFLDSSEIRLQTSCISDASKFLLGGHLLDPNIPLSSSYRPANILPGWEEAV